MTALGIDMSSRDVDLFYWPKPSHHGKPDELLRVENRIDRLSARYIRMCDIEPLPVVELEELDDLIKHLEKIKTRLWNDWQCARHESAPIAVEAEAELKNYLVTA
jgi:hypothetical protein